MYQIHGLNLSSNTTKVVYVAEELGLSYEYIAPDFSKGEHKTPETPCASPAGKTANADPQRKSVVRVRRDCRYLASVEGPHLYPTDDHWQRAVIDQWMNFFTCHIGRHFNAYAFETVAKEKYGFGTPNEAAAKEAIGFIEQQLPAVEARLAASPFLAGEQLSLADLYGFAYSENAEMGNVALDKYPAFARWYAGVKDRPSIARAWNIVSDKSSRCK